MHRYFFIITGLLFFGFIVPVQAAPIPTLDNTAKHRPLSLRTSSAPVDNGLARVVTLGQRGNITNVKHRVQSGRSNRKVTRRSSI